MNYSSVVITLAAGAEDRALEALTALEGLVEVHHVDETSRRVVAVIEAETTGLEADVFERIRRTEGVIDVSLHAHYFEDEATAE